MLNVVGSVAQFEREMMLERQKEGTAKANAQGKYKGRAPTARSKAAEVLILAQSGITKKEIAVKLCISERSVYRIVRRCTQTH